jgi:hypothetical protein
MKCSFFGGIPKALANIAAEFGFATTTDLDAVISDASADLIDHPARVR